MMMMMTTAPLTIAVAVPKIVASRLKFSRTLNTLLSIDSQKY